MKSQGNIRLALVVPALIDGGGVQTVARFVKDIALGSGNITLKIISLSTSSNDPLNSGWLDLFRLNFDTSSIDTGIWDGLSYTHVGANFGKVEFRRYQNRKHLRDLIQDVDLVQVVSGTPAWANAVLGLGKPVVIQVATLAIVERRMKQLKAFGLHNLWRRGMTYITNYLDNRAIRLADAMQVENVWMLSYAKGVNPNSNIQYIPPGIDIELFRPVVNRDFAKDRYILSVGRLDDPRKNIHLLIKAYEILPPYLRDNTKLVFAGSSLPKIEEIKLKYNSEITKNIDLILKPTTQELVEIYSKATLFVLPSDEEGLGLALIEAMSCGVPCISTACGGPENIIENQIDGFLVPLNNHMEMSDKIKLLLENNVLNSLMGHNGREKVKKNFNKNINGDLFIKIWNELASNNK